MVQALYNCRMSELYTILRAGWQACSVNLSVFTAFSAAYTAPLIAARLHDVNSAELLPDFQARNSIAQNLRVDLQRANNDCLLVFRQLQRYISYAFPANQYQAQSDAAGGIYYNEAQNENWDSTVAMLVSMTNFITANSAALLANTNMPAVFPAKVVAFAATFGGTHARFLAAENDAFVATETKVLANNQCYEELIAMFKDAKYLGFSPATMKQFTFSSLLSLISSGGASVLRGTVTDSVTGLPVAGAVIDLTNLGVSVISDVNGNYEFTGVPAGTYNVNCTASGYVLFAGVVVVTVSTLAVITTFDIQMSV